MAKPLSYLDDGEWQIVLDAKKMPSSCEYKFIIMDKATGEIRHWEDGGNRILLAEKAYENGTVFVEMALQYRYDHFSYKGTGTSVPVFSLKTNESFGIGEFTDLYKMIDWASLTRQQLIQLLPVNDTTASRTGVTHIPTAHLHLCTSSNLLGVQVAPTERQEEDENLYPGGSTIEQPAGGRL